MRSGIRTYGSIAGRRSTFNPHKCNTMRSHYTAYGNGEEVDHSGWHKYFFGAITLYLWTIIMLFLVGSVIL